MKKTLEVTLKLTSPDTFDIEISENESGYFLRIECHDRGRDVSNENKKIIDEIRSWVEFMREEENFMKKNEK